MNITNYHGSLRCLGLYVLGSFMAASAYAAPLAMPMPKASSQPAASAHQVTSAKEGMKTGVVKPGSKETQINDAGALPPPDLTPYLGELEKIKRTQRETLQLKQQLDQDKLRADLAKLHGQELGEGASPYVLALTGASNLRQARLVVPGFGELTAQAGDVLPNGWKIVEINDHAVLARHGGDARVQFPFYAPSTQP